MPYLTLIEFNDPMISLYLNSKSFRCPWEGRRVTLKSESTGGVPIHKKD